MRRPNCVPWNIFQTGGVTPAGSGLPADPAASCAATSTRPSPTPTSRSTAASMASRRRGRTAASASTSAPNIARNRSNTAAGRRVPARRRRGPGCVRPCRSRASFDVREAFAELQIPIVSHSFFEELTVGAGYRYSDYKVAGNHFNTDTYKLSAGVGADPRHPGPRAATTAPSALRTWSSCSPSQFVGLGGTVDPCAGAAPTATGRRSALNTGVTAGQYGTITAEPGEPV